jgi:DNA processing protein
LAAVTMEPILRLCTAPGVGPARVSTLLDRFGSAERVLAAPEEALRRVPGIGEAVARAVRAAAGPEGRAKVDEVVDRLRRVGAVALTPDMEDFPEALRSIPDPPFLLFACGDLTLARSPGLAVVGTRTPTDYGRRATERLAGDVARAGFTIVSGMARGIDTVAHTAAFEAGGSSIGVLGCGIDVVYPRENRPLFERMRREGLLLSEYTPGEPPLAGNFPRRNRLVSALGEGVLVVEMGERSGALHTVRYALDQGAEVFAVPGPIGSPLSAGTNQLLKEGARVVTSAEDIIEELRGVGAASSLTVARPHRNPQQPALSNGAAAVEALLSDEPAHVDLLVERSGRPAAEVLGLLLELELVAAVEALPGKRYRRPIPVVLP